jgi:hypothetical protein
MTQNLHFAKYTRWLKWYHSTDGGWRFFRIKTLIILNENESILRRQIERKKNVFGQNNWIGQRIFIPSKISDKIFTPKTWQRKIFEFIDQNEKFILHSQQYSEHVNIPLMNVPCNCKKYPTILAIFDTLHTCF